MQNSDITHTTESTLKEPTFRSACGLSHSQLLLSSGVAYRECVYVFERERKGLGMASVHCPLEWSLYAHTLHVPQEHF